MIARLRRFLSEEDWTFAPQEVPVLPGSPGTVEHRTRHRIAYGVIAVLLGLTGGFGNALISANTYTLQGALGLDPAEIAWLPTVYVMTNVSINLLLIKFRAQFGLRPFAMIFLGLYVLFTLGHLFVREFDTAILVRAASGMAGAAVSSLCLYYMMQALPTKWRLKAVVVGIGIPQCATPLARLFSPDLLAMSQWRTLYLFELGLALLSLAAVALLRLPPTTRSKAFEPLDFVTFVLFAGAMALFAAVLGEGRIVWWANARWIGWALIAAIPMLAAALAIEHHRVNPLLNTRWLGSADIVRFTVVTIMARIVLSEQTYAAVGLLTVLGQNNDQLITFFSIIFLASLAGVVMSAVTLDVERLAHPIMLAIGLVAIAAYADSHATSLTRAPQLYASQALIAFAATYFLGPALLFGMTRALKAGSGHIISFIALFGMINSIGGLAGTALLGSYQQIREKANSAALVQGIDPTDPIVTQRLQAGGAAVARVVGDPGLRSAEGAAILSQTATREANVLAYDDVFRLIALLAALTFCYLLFLIIRRAHRERRAASSQSAA
ncbi:MULTISPECIES: MFS transporter [unclassified Sphingomonas]|uniref:MFS transporter n=1 Tax=unclassified Sphingomonas TaxID=196159 RepID=UPI0004520654|nr:MULTISPECIES: MFS transporter [unclassified Sphingomonas]EZP51650.1 Major Facilitator Superfamily protein [Sphingomonas sp. RIT328]